MWVQLTVGEWRLQWRLYGWLVLGLVLSAALISGVKELINAAESQFQAAQSYQQATPSYRIQSVASGYHIDYALWQSIRAQGIDANPVIIGRLKLDNERWLPVRGMTMPNFDSSTSWHTLVDSSVASQLAWGENDTPLLNDGRSLPPLTVVEAGGGWLLMDLAPAVSLLNSNQKVSYLQIDKLSVEHQQWLEQRLPAHLELVNDGRRLSQKKPLYDAFSMNLTALGALSFVVGLFLAYHAISRIIDARLQRQQILNQLGMPNLHLRWWGMIELALVALLTGLLGSVVGVELAKQLSSGLELTLTALYRLDQPIDIQWQLQSAIFPVALLLASVLMLVAFKMIHWQSRFSRIAAIAVFVAIAWLSLNAANQAEALLLAAFTLIGAIIAIPIGLSLVISLLTKRSARLSVLWRWAVADIEFYRQGLSSALVAVSLALAMAIATRMLVGSFEVALNHHLEQRLFADVYIRGGEQELQKWYPQLQQTEGITDVKALSERHGELEGRTVLIKTIATNQEPTDVYHFKGVNPNWWQLMEQQEACLVNEPLQLNRHVKLGQIITLSSGNTSLQCKVAGIYYDYGNPNWEVTFSYNGATKHFAYLPFAGLGLTTSLSEAEIETLLSNLSIPTGSIFWQASIVSTAKSLFKKTFLITDALATLTLGVALVAWLAGLMAQRQRTSATNGLWFNLGLSAKALAKVRLMQLTLLMALTLMFAVVVGLILGWQLLAVVNPLSFGWSMAVKPLSGNWYLWLIITMVATTLAALLPTTRPQLATGERL